ncbi:MAG: hypothetical protein ACTS3F_00855 [Phycisphaerales bacterium]
MSDPITTNRPTPARIMNSLGGATVGLIAALTLISAAGFAAFSQDRPNQSQPQPPAQPQPESQPEQPQPPKTPASPIGALGAMLIEQIKSVEGCLGVETASLPANRVSIIAWFEDAEAAKRWFHHPVHQRLMFTGQQPGDIAEQRPPMEHVPPGVPVMVIATLTLSDRPQIPGVPIPISQISIELYTPLPGGASINGRLAPESLDIPHMRKIALPKPNADQPAR